MANRFLTWKFVCLLILGSILGSSAYGQNASGMVSGAVGADPQVQNAVSAVEEALKAKHTNRGASGSVASLLTSSDTIICSSWIVSFRTSYRNMVIDGAPADMLAKMQKLMDLVEKNCDKILNSAAYKVGGGGQGTKQVGTPTVERNDCPECDVYRRARDRAQAARERAEYKLNVSMRWTDFVEQVHGDPKNATPQQRAAVGGETPKSAEKQESKDRAKVSNAKRAEERAQKKLVDCLEKCHKKVRQTLGFLGNNAPTYALASAAVAGTYAVSRGGGETTTTPVSTSEVGTPGNQTSSSIGTSPQPSPPAAPGYQACAGPFNASFTVHRDVGGHRRFVGMPGSMGLNLSFASIHIAGQAPFVKVDGPITQNGSFEANGMGSVAGFNNVSVRMTGSVTGCTATSGTLEAMYVMGANGELPGGESITYMVRGTK